MPTTIVNSFKDRPLDKNESLPGIIAETGSPLYIPNHASEDPRLSRGPIARGHFDSFVGVPILAKGHRVGVLILLNKEPNRLLPEDLQLCQALGAQVGMAIRNAQLFARHKSLEEELEAQVRGKEILLREVNHRLKNNMMAVASILGLQADSLQENTDPAQALRDAQARVRSLIVMYEKLYVSSYTDMVSMKDFLSSLVDEVLENYSPPYPIELKTAFFDFPISARHLQPLSIIINELVTNALKYAFEANKPGEITVTCDYRPPLVQIIVADNGRGLPEGLSFETSQGFGLQLVYALVGQLQGTAAFDTQKPGARIVIEFPIENTPA